jgi:lipoyl(octanoyl) transferase
MMPDGRAEKAEGSKAHLKVVDAGLVPYADALAIQREIAAAKKHGAFDEDVLLIVEHPAVITLGRGTRDEDVILAPEVLEARGIPIVEIERGGDVTYHGPGQLVGYPILDLHHYRCDLHWYLRTLERALANALGHLGLRGFRIEGYTGLWVGEAAPASSSSPEAVPVLDPSTAPARIIRGEARKIASIGVHASRWITWHGFALNVTEEPLTPFEWIVPCGIQGACMTSLHAEGVRVGRDEVVRELADGFSAVFGVRLEWGDRLPALPPVADEVQG